MHTHTHIQFDEMLDLSYLIAIIYVANATNVLACLNN